MDGQTNISRIDREGGLYRNKMLCFTLYMPHIYIQNVLQVCVPFEQNQVFKLKNSIIIFCLFGNLTLCVMFRTVIKNWQFRDKEYAICHTVQASYLQPKCIPSLDNF